jgi:hypothetical protein
MSPPNGFRPDNEKRTLGSVDASQTMGRGLKCDPSQPRHHEEGATAWSRARSPLRLTARTPDRRAWVAL